MEYLQESCNVIPLKDISRHLEENEPFPDRAVAVTFDCGYSDILHVARHVLQRLKLRATVFVGTTNMIRHANFWWDELEDLIIPERTRRELELEIDGELCSWVLETQRDRFAAFEDLHAILADKSSWQQCRLIELIRRGSGRLVGECDCHCTLKVQDLHVLEDGGLIDIGGHVHNSVDLHLSPNWRQDSEISRNKRALEEILNHPVTCVSHTLDAGNIGQNVRLDIIRELGYQLGFGNSYGTVSQAHAMDCCDLPRVKVGNWQPFVFHQFLDRLFK